MVSAGAVAVQRKDIENPGIQLRERKVLRTENFERIN